jgi:hypothetical protein
VTAAAPPAARRDTLPVVREKVKDILTSNQAFWHLPPEQRKELARDMVKVGAYMADAGGETAGVPMQAVLESEQAAGDVGATVAPARQQLFEQPTTAGSRFRSGGGAAAAEAGTHAMTAAIGEVNFPAFVGGLIDGVFNAIVGATIKQMNAFSDLVSNVAKSVDQYMKDNITDNQSRDYLASKYPDHLEVDLEGDEPKLKPREGADQDSLPDFFKDLGLDAPVESLDEDTAESLVQPARRRIAMDRQQLLATMVLMGVNRLVVTQGKIKAHVLFKLDTVDKVTQKARQASSFDSHSKVTSKQSEGGFWWWYTPEVNTEYSSNFNVSTVQNDDSESSAKLHAELGGDVEVNFRSETFPLEKMGALIQPETLQQKAAGGAPTAAPAGAGAAPPAAAPPAAGR